MKTSRYLGLLLLCLLCIQVMQAQQLRLGNNPYTVEKSAVLELQSTNQGLLFPRITDTLLINALNPPDGMVIFFTTTSQLMVRSNGYWKPQTTSEALRNYWSVNGNSNGAAKKIGNIDNYNLSLITNNIERLHILANGNIGIGNTNPTEKLDITGNLNLSGAFMPGNTAGTAGYVLRSNGAGAAPTWQNFALANLSDATIIAPVNGQLLQYNGTKWVNTTPAYLTSIDTANIANFHVKVKSLFSGTAPITYNNGVIGISQANASTNGYVSSTDWATFNSKLSAVDTSNISNFHVKVKSIFSATGPATFTNGVIGMTQANASTSGYLSSTDWNNFNNKLASIDTSSIANFHVKVKSLFSGTAPITYNNGVIGISQANASTNGYVSSTDWATFNSKLSAVDTSNISNFHVKVKSIFSATGPATFNNGVIGMTQANASTSGYLSSTDWNNFNNKLASIDTSSIANFHVKVKSVFTGTGPITYNNGNISMAKATSAVNGYLSSADWTTFNSKLSTVDTSNISNFHVKVKSVFSATGPATFTNGVIGMTQANASTSGYLSSTDWNNFNNKLASIDTSSIANFHVKVKSLFSGTAPITYNNGVIGISQANASTNGYVSSTDWTTFNSKLSSVDTANIANFHVKVKSVFTGTGPVTYNNGNISMAKATSAVNGYLSSADWTTFNSKLSAVDTSNISNFHVKVKSLLSAGTGISYNANGVIGNTGVLSVNGNTGALTMDTGYINNFHTKVKSLLSAGTGITYNATTGVISSSISAGNFWNIGGNTGINSATNFLGTTDDKALILKSNSSPYVEMGRRATLGLTQGYADYDNDDEQVMHMKSVVQFYAPAAQFYKPKIFVDANGNFRTKGSSAGTDYFEFGATGTNNDGGFEFIIGDDGDEPIVFKSYDYQTGMSEIMRLQSGRMAVGSNAFDATNPEKLLIDAGVTDSYNLMTGKGSINNYLQINVQNRSSGNTASSDMVATADNGNENINFIDMGINSSGFSNTTYPILGGINNAYLYSTGNDFILGNGTASKNLRLFTGGFAAANERLRIDGTGNVGIGTTAPTAKLDVAGTVKLGAKGTIEKNIISFEIALASATAVAGASLNTVFSTFSPGVTELTVTIPAANTPTTTRGSVSVSADQDLPTNVSIASARIATTSTVKIRFFNNGTGNQTLPLGLKLYITITEF